MSNKQQKPQPKPTTIGELLVYDVPEYTPIRIKVRSKDAYEAFKACHSKDCDQHYDFSVQDGISGYSVYVKYEDFNRVLLYGGRTFVNITKNNTGAKPRVSYDVEKSVVQSRLLNWLFRRNQ